MARGNRCYLCGGNLRKGRCVECGLDNDRMTKRKYRLNETTPAHIKYRQMEAQRSEQMKYAKEYKRIMKEGWKAELEDIAVYDKVFDRDYYIRATVNSGCTNCGKCLRSHLFTQKDGVVSAKNEVIRMSIVLGLLTIDIGQEKYEVVYYARECPAKCIQYEFYKD